MRVNPLSPSSNVDVPDVVLHMTGRSGRKAPSVLPGIAAISSAERLASILWLRQMHAFTVFRSDWPVVCFTHTTRRALAGSHRFDGVGIAFHVQSVFNVGGGPVLYVRGDEFDAVHGNPTLPEAFRSRIVRWWPGASEEDPVENFMLPHSVSGVTEWTHEREWRIPRPANVTAPWSWTFAPEDVAFLLLPNQDASDEVWGHLRGFGLNPAVPPSELTWLETVPVATRTKDGWAFVRGDAPGWT